MGQHVTDCRFNRAISVPQLIPNSVKMPPKQMTANPTRPARYRPGKPLVEERLSDEEASDEEGQRRQRLASPAPKALSYTASVSKLDLAERRRLATEREAARIEAEKTAKAKLEEGFVTESDEESATDSSDQNSERSEGDEETSEEEEGSSEDEAPKKLIRPVFLSKSQRIAKGTSTPSTVAEKTEEEQYAEEEARRRAKADELVQAQLEKAALARAAGKKYWDDDEEGAADDVDDTDDMDPEAERAEWKLRELQRIARARKAIEEAEKERAEIERRRNMTTAEREAEDRERLAEQEADKGEKAKAGYLQKYFHKGAFFQDDAKEVGLDKRDLMGAQFEDQVDRETLPQYMQIRDLTKLGRKGRTRYKDLKSEDTGRFGVQEYYAGRNRRGGDGEMMMGGVDDRFKPDDDRFRPDGHGCGGGASRTGANAGPVGDRKRGPPTGVPDGPSASGERKRPRVNDGG